MTQALLKSTKRKEKLYLKYIKNPTTENKSVFTTYRNKYKLIRKKAEQTYYTNEFTKFNNDIKKTWQIIRTIVKREDRDTVINELNINGIPVNDAELMAEKFNFYFTGLAKSLSAKIPAARKNFNEYMLPSVINSFVLLSTTPDELITISKTLKSTHSAGFDDVDPYLTTPVMDLLAIPLAEIINCSLRNGVVPSAVKLARILPIHKQGSRSELSNYRPISILPFFSKLFERVMYDRLSKEHPLPASTWFSSWTLHLYVTT